MIAWGENLKEFIRYNRFGISRKDVFIDKPSFLTPDSTSTDILLGLYLYWVNYIKKLNDTLRLEFFVKKLSIIVIIFQCKNDPLFFLKLLYMRMFFFSQYFEFHIKFLI